MLTSEGKQRGCYDAGIRCCERNKICGCLPQVAYIPVFVPTHCGNCQPTCKKCEQPNKQEFAVGACQSSNIRKCPNCHSDEASGTATNECISGQNNQYYKLCLCDGNPHFSRVLIPQIGLPCQTDVSATLPSGNDKCASYCQCQATSQNNRTLNVKYEWPESSRHACALRRSSDDSGRVTWSDSGESIFSDYQIADPIRRNNIATQTAMMSTNRQRKISKMAEFTAERRHQQQLPDDSSLKVTGYLPYSDESSYPRSNHSDDTHSSQNSEIPCGVKNTVFSDWKRSKIDSGNDCHEKSASPPHDPTNTNSIETGIKYQRDEDIGQLCTPTPRRSCSDWMLRKTDRMTGKQRKSRLDSLQEHDITPRRPRSKSLFVGAGRHPLLLSRTKIREKSDSGQTHQLDFTSWHTLKKTWNIGENGPDEIGKSYGLVAVPSMQGIAITNTNDVKIKIYRTDGEKILAFGTPTWPNHGRAITRSNTGEHLIVSHISGVCTYALDGKLVHRYSHENTPGLFWGGACDNEDNHVVTDPKSSSIFIMTSYGEVLRQIGGETNNLRTRSNPSKRSRRGKKKRSNEKQLSADELNNATESNGENLVTSTVTRMIDRGPENEKKQARLLAPRYVAVNSKNQILVTDTTQRCLVIMENDGTQLFTVGGGRSGCHRCRRPTDGDPGRNIQNVLLATDFCIRIPMQSPPTKEPLSRMSSDTVFEQEESPEPVANYFAEICGNKANCKSKSARPKVLGAISRAQIARGESVESQSAYQTVSHKKSLKLKSKTLKEEWDSHSSRVAYRLSSHMREMSIECDSCLDLSLEKETKDTTAHKHGMKSFRKSVKGMWKGKDRKKRKLGQSDILKCDSLTSLSCDTSTGNEQPCHEDLEMNDRFPNPKVEIEQATHSVCSSDTDEILKHHSAPDVSPRGDFDFSDPLSPTTLDFEMNYGRRHSDDSCSLDVAQELDSDEDNDTSSCRKCHVGDPRGICVDKNDNILLADYARHRVSVFDPTGHFVRHLLTEKDGLRQPNALCVIDNSTIAVKDSDVGIKIFQFVAGE